MKMVEKYILNCDKTEIEDINPSAFDINDHTIVFPAEIDGNKITKISITEKSRDTLYRLYKWFDVVIEDGIKTMSDKMFWRSNIRSVTIPPSMESISFDCFTYSKLQKVAFQEGSTLKTIEKTAFAYCSQLHSISLPQTIERIKDGAFRSSSLTEITFPKCEHGIDIGEFAFADCPYLEEVTFPKMSVNFGRKVFYCCETLRSVKMNETNMDIVPAGMFSGCKVLIDAILPETTTMIGEGAFCECSMLKTVGLGSTKVSCVLKSAFEECYDYSDGEFPSTIRFIGDRAFMRCGINKLSLPSSTLEKVENHAFCGNPLSEGIDLTPFTSCTSIGDYIFSECNMKSVTLPSFKAEENISCRFMFSACIHLKEVQMEDGAQLFEGIFSNCDKLDAITLSETLSVIPAFAFTRCSSLKKIKFPKSITKIAASAFKLTDLTSVDLSESKSMEIGSESFLLTYASEVNLPAYNCTICTDSFSDSVFFDIIGGYPFLTIKESI